MKQLVLRVRLYDNETANYIQRFLKVDLTEKEAGLFEQLKASLDARVPHVFPFKEKGWCDDDEVLDLETPLVDSIDDGEGGTRHRFHFSQGLYLQDTKNPDYGCGWSGI